MKVEPQKEHYWLQRLVGDWTIESEVSMGPGQAPMKYRGRETVRSFGGVWVLCEGQGDMPGGGTGQMIMTLGYDPARSRFVGSFIGTMMTNMWIYDGQLDAAEKILTLDTEGPSFTTPGQMTKYQDIIEMTDNDHRILRSTALGDDGKWVPVQTAHYTRQK